MDIQFVDIKQCAKTGVVPTLEKGDVAFGINVNDTGTLILGSGVPQHRIVSNIGVVTFGLQRLHRQEERNSHTSISNQVYNFIAQNPRWKTRKFYRPIYDIGPDDALAAALLDVPDELTKSDTNLNAFISELNEWVSNRYSFVKNVRPRILNAFLNEFPYPFRDEKGVPRTESCRRYLLDQIAWFVDELEGVASVRRKYPNDLKFETLFNNDLTAMILVDQGIYGTDDLITQLYFESNPSCVRVIIARKMINSVKHLVSVANANMYNEALVAFPYPNVKDLNLHEKKIGGEPSWKNLKVQTTSPRKGTGIPLEVIWNAAKIGE